MFSRILIMCTPTSTHIGEGKRLERNIPNVNSANLWIMGLWMISFPYYGCLCANYLILAGLNVSEVQTRKQAWRGQGIWPRPQSQCVLRPASQAASWPLFLTWLPLIPQEVGDLCKRASPPLVPAAVAHGALWFVFAKQRVRALKVK